MQNLEFQLERALSPLKRFVPIIARFLLVSTFLEDSLRMILQWEDQKYYFEYFKHYDWGLTMAYLSINLLGMLLGSFLVIIKKKVLFACLLLIALSFLQAVTYGLLFNLIFMTRLVSLIGGFLLLASDSMLDQISSSVFAGLPSLGEREKHHYISLLGRVLLVFLFITITFTGKFSWLRVIFGIFSGLTCVLVVVGFKARHSALFLVALLSIFNIILNDYWTLSVKNPNRDFVKYDFFQTLSVIGGLLLLFSTGPGAISLEKSKKL